MKQITALSLLMAVIITLSGCYDTAMERNSNVLEPFQEGPVSITWNGDKNADVKSYQANVQVYSMNNRKDTAAGLSRTYSMAVRSFGDKVLTRINFEKDNSMPFRSVISDGEEAVVFNPETEEIGYRITLEDSKSPLYRIFGNQSAMSRINLSLVREEARRLSLNLTEDTVSKTLLLELPPELLPSNGFDKIIQSRAVFNLANDTLQETEVVMVREDETIVTTTVTLVYEDKDGVPVKIGMITVIDSKTSKLIEGIDPNYPVYNSPDDIPTLTAEQFAEMKETGNIHEVAGITFGDPADLSYIETIYEVYQDIEINAVPESMFRLIQK
jgi:outer membrane lipoprotein-sorting protein